MENLNFLPKWYLKKRESINNKKMKFIIIIIFLLNVFLINMVIYNVNKLNYLNKDIGKQVEVNKKRVYNQNNAKYKKSGTIHSFINFYNNIYANLNCKSVCIKDNKIELEIYINNKSEYISTIKYIELNKTYKILGLSGIVEENENLKFNILLGVNKDEQEY